MKVRIFLFFCLFSNITWGQKVNDRVHLIKGDGMEIVWLEENRFPTYDLTVYFAEGSLGEDPKLAGISNSMFDLLTYGTKEYNQQYIHNFLEFYGASYGGMVASEYSLFNLSGLNKDFEPTLTFLCKLFKTATFPDSEVLKDSEKKIATLKNMVTSHPALASRIYRHLLTQNTLLNSESTGTLKTLASINSQDLKKRLDFYNQKVFKRVYLSGPKQLVKSTQEILQKECEWKNSKDVKQISFSLKNEFKDRPIYFVPVKEANQAQVFMGRLLDKSEVLSSNLYSLAFDFLGGSYTSKLNEELRTKRGLTYGAYAKYSEQKNYAVVSIQTSTRSEKVVEMLEVIEKLLTSISAEEQDGISQEEFEKTVKYSAGSFFFEFEENADFLGNLLTYDHLQKSYQELYAFPYAIKEFSKESLQRAFKKIFESSQMVILVLGEDKILPWLKKKGHVQVLSYKDYL
ncbi:MAG: insulinase family protein [Bacteriovoracaceae bacterium]|nr:insulinase family protein [Bacteriovoracaceae bacterium]